jgi:hypothetical protein
VLAAAAARIRANRESQIETAETLAREWQEPTPASIQSLKAYGHRGHGKCGNVVARTIDYLERHKYDIRAEIEYSMLNGYSLGFFDWHAHRPSDEEPCRCQAEALDYVDYENEQTYEEQEERARYEAEREAREVKKRTYKSGYLSRLFPNTGNRYSVDVFGTADWDKWFALQRWLSLYYGYSIVATASCGHGPLERDTRQSFSIYWA